MTGRRRSLLLPILLLVSTFLWSQSPPATNTVQFVFTSDSHYGLKRPSFRGRTNVDSHVVNAAMVAAIRRLLETSFPADGGIRSGMVVGSFDFLADGGDIANREEKAAEIQSAAASWAQFRSDYIDGLKFPVFVVPGNHDAANAIGYYKPLSPATDKSSMMEIFNLMMRPVRPKTPATYDYSKDKMETSRDIGGIHFMFLTIWPDAGTRTWMENDLKHVNSDTPVMIFTHVPPNSDPKMFTGAAEPFENLLPETFTDERQEQQALENFVYRHPNITAYFHGHNNWNQFYDWTGPSHSVVLHTFRADSPMKGHFSATDETKLSFQAATIDMVSRTMTVREVFWNADPQHPEAPAAWGGSTTVALSPRPAAK